MLPRSYRRLHVASEDTKRVARAYFEAWTILMSREIVADGAAFAAFIAGASAAGRSMSPPKKSKPTKKPRR
jgi:hypothetical protein